MNQEIVYELKFNDRTILESEGCFDVVKQLMEKESFSKKWMVESGMTMVITIGEKVLEAFFVLHFYHDGIIYIVDYSPSGGDVYSNPDVRGLATWAGENGWKSVRPHNDLVRTNLDFWKYFWETNLIDSDYLDNHCGARDSVQGS